MSTVFSLTHDFSSFNSVPDPEFYYPLIATSCLLELALYLVMAFRCVEYAWRYAFAVSAVQLFVGVVVTYLLLQEFHLERYSVFDTALSMLMILIGTFIGIMLKRRLEAIPDRQIQ